MNTKVKDTLDALNEAIKYPIDSKRIAIDASIHRFKLVFEVLTRYITNLDAFNIISKKLLWESMAEDHQRCDFAYDQEIADEIYSRLPTYYYLMQTIYERISVMALAQKRH